MSDVTSNQYDAQGEKTAFTDENGTTHIYSYDVLGRMTKDEVIAFGPNIDQSVKVRTFSFNDAGLPYQQAAWYDTNLTEQANVITDTYNGLGQLTSEAENTGTVQYKYATDGSGNPIDGSRLVSMVYPDGRTIDYFYGGISPISNISFNSSTNTATVTTTQPTGYVAGSTFTIQGASVLAFDGTFTVTAVIDSTHFQFTPTSTPSSNTDSATTDTDMVAIGVAALSGAATLDGTISRLTGMQDTYDGTILAGYQYLGLSTVVQEDRPQPGVDPDLHPPARRQPGRRYWRRDRYTGRVQFEPSVIRTGRGWTTATPTRPVRSTAFSTATMPTETSCTKTTSSSPTNPRSSLTTT